MYDEMEFLLLVLGYVTETKPFTYLNIEKTWCKWHLEEEKYDESSGKAIRIVWDGSEANAGRVTRWLPPAMI